MNYVSPRFAPLITPPTTAIVEYQPNGGLFMAATDETFVASNPQHLAVAHDILPRSPHSTPILGLTIGVAG